MRTLFKPGLIILGMVSILILFFTMCEEEKDGTLSPITIENVAGPRSGVCGEFFWQVRFRLAAASPLGGWFIQKITVKRQATVNCPAVYPAIDVTYWEAWQVHAGKDVSTFVEANTNDFDDQYSGPSWPDSEGFHKTDGELRFYEDLTLPADFTARNPRTYAGILPSTTTQPAFWGAGDVKSHKLNLDWDCCDTAVQDMTTIPEFAGKPQRTITPHGGPFFEEVEPLKAWTDSSGYTTYDNQHLIESAMSLSTFTDNEILLGVTEYADHYAGCMASMSKLFLLLRVFYDVPSSIPAANARSYGSWIRPQEDLTAPTYDPLWPLGLDTFQVPVVLHTYMGYIGAPYDPVGEAVYFMEAFGRRSL